MDKKTIVVYGSLLSGLRNHGYLINSKLISKEVVVIPYKMVSLGAFPGLIKSSSKHSIQVEIYEVDDDVYKDIEILEGYPTFYDKYNLKTSNGESEIYVLTDGYDKNPVVSVNLNNVYDWKYFLKQNKWT